jgi:hypothetical protein
MRHAYAGLYVDRPCAKTIARTNAGAQTRSNEMGAGTDLRRPKTQPGRSSLAKIRYLPCDRSPERHARADLQFQPRSPTNHLLFGCLSGLLRTPPGFASIILQDKKLQCLRYLRCRITSKLILWISQPPKWCLSTLLQAETNTCVGTRFPVIGFGNPLGSRVGTSAGRCLATSPYRSRMANSRANSSLTRAGQTGFGW